MKPDWKDAPEWAQWTAMDGDGRWCWFEFEPTFCECTEKEDDFWVSKNLGRWQRVRSPSPPIFSLQARP